MVLVLQKPTQLRRYQLDFCPLPELPCSALGQLQLVLRDQQKQPCFQIPDNFAELALRGEKKKSHFDMLSQSIQCGGSLGENTSIALLMALGVIDKRLINALSQHTNGYFLSKCLLKGLCTLTLVPPLGFYHSVWSNSWWHDISAEPKV